MIPNSRMRNCFYPATCQIISLQESIIASTIILVISQRQDGDRVHIDQQICGIFLAA